MGTEELERMFEMQLQMQRDNATKRFSIIDPDSDDVQERIKAAMFYWNCVTAEYAEFWLELEKGLSKDKFEVSDEAREEYIDMLHFVLSMLIYIGHQRPGITLEWIFECIRSTEKIIKKMHGGKSELTPEHKVRLVETFWNNLSKSWGHILNGLPYKNWKTYPAEELKLFNQENDSILRIFMAEFFNIGHLIGMDEKDIYLEYLNKWKENEARQKPGGKYEE